MTIQLVPPARPADADGRNALDPEVDLDLELDITFIEAGGTVEHIIQMTGDNCGTTCESACTSC